MLEMFPEFCEAVFGDFLNGGLCIAAECLEWCKRGFTPGQGKKMACIRAHPWVGVSGQIRESRQLVL